MRNLIRVAAAAAFAGTVVAMVAGPAAGHQLDRADVTCATVSGTFHDFTAHEHPIVWHVQVGAGASQAVGTTESPAAFIGAGTATADISALTDQLAGATATVTAYATWPGGQSAPVSAPVTCGTAAPDAPPAAAPRVSGIEAEAPAAPAVAPAAVPVPAAAHFTG